jgi:hypothetical protein
MKLAQSVTLLSLFGCLVSSAYADEKLDISSGQWMVIPENKLQDGKYKTLLPCPKEKSASFQNNQFTLYLELEIPGYKKSENQFRCNIGSFKKEPDKSYTGISKCIYHSKLPKDITDNLDGDGEDYSIVVYSRTHILFNNVHYGLCKE